MMNKKGLAASTLSIILGVGFLVLVIINAGSFAIFAYKIKSNPILLYGGILIGIVILVKRRR